MTRIVVASGKGGTGKTTIATSLALAARLPTRLMDCDVEAPNAALFLAPTLVDTKDVGIMIPTFDEELCTYCGVCAKVCEFHAIAVVGKKILFFPELCHGCGSCGLVCPTGVISEKLDVMGVLTHGQATSALSGTSLEFSQGTMNVGEPMAVPIIRELKKWSVNGQVGLEIRDAPPGASCPVVESIRGADYVVLVTEPTPFGLHDLKQVAQLVKDLDLPAGVIINRDGIGDEAVANYCAESGLPILGRVPMERRFSEAIASGKTLVEAAPEYVPLFENILDQITEQVGR